MRGRKLKTVRPIDVSSIGYKMFKAFMRDEQLAVAADEMVKFALEELKIPKKRITDGFLRDLPEILVFYMNIWGGWYFKNEVDSGEWSEEYSYTKFQNFLHVKIAKMLKGPYQQFAREQYAPYMISVKCPPQISNTVHFVPAGDHVLMEHQPASTNDQLLTLRHILNWPDIQVTFSTEDIFFIRKQSTEIKRYLKLHPPIGERENLSKIEFSEALGPQECFSVDFFERYFSEYLNVLANDLKLNNLKLAEIRVILDEFLRDIKYLDINNSMASNTSVSFRLCQFPYLRDNQEISSDKHHNTLHYCEVIIPKVELLMPSFKAEQLQSNRLSFKYLEKVKTAGAKDFFIVPKISYKCNFCNIEFSGVYGRQRISAHLTEQHKAETPVMCTGCNQHYTVYALAGNGWRHDCSAK